MDTQDFDVDNATKDELVAYALEKFGKELAPRTPKAELVEEVKVLMDVNSVPATADSDAGSDDDPNSKTDTSGNADPSETGGDDNGEVDSRQYVLNPRNNRVLLACPEFIKMVKAGELVFCDRNGKRL